MGKRNTGHNSILFDVQTMTQEELEETYYIEIDDDGRVYDPCEMREFESLALWAVSVEQQEQTATPGFEKRGNKHSFDDE